MARRRIKKVSPKLAEITLHPEELASELEEILEGLKTSTVSHSKEKLRALVFKLRQRNGASGS